MSKKRKASRLSGNDYLYVIEKFAIRVAQSIIGGQATNPNNSSGDLYHEDRGAFSEVKASGLSSGPIVCRDQLKRHLDELEHFDHDYVFVLYTNREYSKGKWRYLPRRMSKTDHMLENFLVRSVREIFIIHISVIKAIFGWRRKDIKCYVMQRGPKTYLKIYPAILRRLVDDDQFLAQLNLDPNQFRVERKYETARYGRRRVEVIVSRVELKPVSDDDLFDVSVLESDIPPF